MARSDRVLIDPGRDEFFLALQEAVDAANERRKRGLIAWPVPGLEDLPAELGTAEGYRQYNGGDGQLRGGEGRSIVALAWWTDRAARKHCRIVGHHANFTRPMLRNMICPAGEPRPSLWFVYPDHVYLIRHDGRRATQAMCACGAHGDPEELGWMGTMCDTCHDLAYEGHTPTPAWLDPRQATLQGEEGRSIFLAYSPDGKTLAAGTGRDHVVLWDTTSGHERGRLQARPDDWLLGVAWVRGHALVTASASGVLQHYSGRTGLPAGEPLRIPHSDCFAMSPDGQTAVRSDRSGVSLIGIEEDGPVRDLEGELPAVAVAAFSADGRLLAAGSRQGKWAVWDVATGRLRGQGERPGAIVSGLAFDAAHPTLAVTLLPAPGGSSDAQHVLLWDTREDAVRAELPGHPGGTRCAAFSPDGRLLASGGEDGLVRLWDLPSGHEKLALEWHLDCATAVAFAPDGLALASAGFDGKVKLWPREVLRPARRNERVGVS